MHDQPGIALDACRIVAIVMDPMAVEGRARNSGTAPPAPAPPRAAESPLLRARSAPVWRAPARRTAHDRRCHVPRARAALAGHRDFVAHDDEHHRSGGAGLGGHVGDGRAADICAPKGNGRAKFDAPARPTSGAAGRSGGRKPPRVGWPSALRVDWRRLGEEIEPVPERGQNAGRPRRRRMIEQRGQSPDRAGVGDVPRLLGSAYPCPRSVVHSARPPWLTAPPSKFAPDGGAVRAYRGEGPTLTVRRRRSAAAPAG